jgi:hypothetical protein
MESNYEVLMMKEDGCIECRNCWVMGKSKRPHELSTDYENKTTLYQCPVCGTYWEEGERTAQTISLESANMKYKMKKLSGNIFSNPIDEKIQMCKEKNKSIFELISYLLKKDVLVPSYNKLDNNDDKFVPVIGEVNNESCVVIFTDKEKLKSIKEYSQHYLKSSLENVIKEINNDLGMIVNPNTDFCFQISREGLEQIKKDFYLI